MTPSPDVVPFSEFFKVKSQLQAGYKQNQYLKQGALPIIDQGINLIGGYTNELDREIRVDKPVVVFGDHTRCVKYVRFNFALGADGVKVLEVMDDVDSKFAFYHLLAIPLRNRGYARHMGELRKAGFWKPTLDVQRAIVETIDDYLSRLDKAQAELSSAHSKLDVFRRSAIEALTIGDETWTTSALGDVTNVNWGDTSLTKSSYRDAGFTAFSASGPDGFIDKYDFDKDGVVLSAIGAACGKVFFATGKWSGIKNTICITPKDSAVSAKYLYYFLNDTNGWQKRGAAQPFIRQADARARTVRYPNLNKQQELIETLEAQITLFEILSKDLQNQMQQVVLLRRSVLKIAFEGNLRGQ